MENSVVVAVKAAILGPSGRYLAVQRSAQDDIGAGRWEFPGGKLEFENHKIMSDYCSP